MLVVRKKLILLLIITMLCSCLSGCEKKTPLVTTTVYPIKYIINQLVGDRVIVEYIDNEVFIQRATVRVNYKSILEKTDLFLFIGGLEPYMDIYEQEVQGYSFDIINLASLSAIDKFQRYTTTKVNNISVVTESRYYEGTEFNQVDTYNKDPFIWIDPIAMSSMASTVKDWLQKQFPEDSLQIENNFKILQANLVRMDAEYQNLKNLNAKIVTVACTFGNWQKAYGVQVYPLVLSKYGVLPTEAQLEVIKKAIVNAGVKYIVKDRTLPDDMQKLYQEIQKELQLKELNISSLSILSEEDIEKNKDYMTIMYENLVELEEAFK